MRKLAFFCLIMASTAIHAEVFKCVGSFGKTVYQSRPCTNTSKEQQLDIETTPDPAQEAAAKAKLDAARAEYQAKKTADEQLQAEKNKAAAAEMELAGKNAIGQQQQQEDRQRQKEEFGQ